jgi:phosphatidylglycerol:prolipoprotein diacylglycerol transferase
MMPNIDPVLISLGPVMVRWYGVMFLAAFAATWGLARQRAAADGSTWQHADVDLLVFWSVIGAIVGGRLGWLVLHALDSLITDPFRVLRLWEGGMSFHGALIGTLAALVRFARIRSLRVADVLDFATPLVPVSLGAVHFAKFVKGEIWGTPTPVPALFIHVGLPRFPVQAYEAALEGLALGTAMWFFTRTPRPRLAPSGLFLTGYGCSRFVMELVRIPDAVPGSLLLGWMTTGQLLSIPTIALGAFLLGVAYHRRQPSGNARSWAEPAA